MNAVVQGSNSQVLASSYASLGAYLLGTLLCWHTTSAQNLDKCTSLPGEQASSALATLTTHVSHVAFRQGEPVRVALILRAGSNGAYLPAYFADFMKTCEHGFAASLLTPAGKAADLHEPGCSAIVGHSKPGVDSARSEFANFIRLGPGETRAWHTTLKTTAIESGRYCLYAEYLSFGYMIDDVARLPEVGGLMAKGRITAKPIPVEIH